MKNTYTPHTSLKKRLVVFACIVFVLGALLAVLELSHVTHFFHKSKTYIRTPTTGGSSVGIQKGEPQPTNTTPATGNTTEPGDNKSNTGSNITTTLLTPSADSLVSNHHPNLSGSPAPNTLSSVCTTSPGASCTITFTKDGVTKSLPAQTTDRGGSTYWNNWSLQGIGLTQGSWHIQAVATLNGQTKNISDSMNLEVAQ